MPTMVANACACLLATLLAKMTSFSPTCSPSLLAAPWLIKISMLSSAEAMSFGIRPSAS